MRRNFNLRNITQQTRSIPHYLTVRSNKTLLTQSNCGALDVLREAISDSQYLDAVLFMEVAK